jgi:WD40 repeat protein/tRNA A-37 threonylcarbamoyl transferase component Bud32
MTEREIFLEALDCEDSAARAAYLDAACAGQPALRQRVEQLLRCEREDPTYLNVPVMEQLAAAEDSLAFLGPGAEPDSLGRLDHYEVLHMVGRGGTGVVVKARDTKLQRIVAVKALAPWLAASDAARQRFVREAQAAAAVRDDNVVAIYAVSEDSRVPYLVMEYICGLTLEQRLQQDKALQLTEILRIGMQTAAGLAAAHAQGLVHRDIKPANILLENSIQRVKITDFGLAGVAADAGTGTTAGGALAGTPLYMSPEQARGETTDHRTDLFSLGSVLYTLCAGRSPFQADTTLEVLRRIRVDTPQPVHQINPDVPEWFDGLIGRLHAKEASARLASAREVADLLGGQLALLQQPSLHAPPSAVPVGSVQPAHRPRGVWPSRRLILAMCLAGLLVAAVALLLIWWRRGLESRDGGENRPAKSAPVEPLELRREDIPPTLMALAGGGDPRQAPPELASVLGGGRFLLPRLGSITWMRQSPDEKTLAVPQDEDVVLFEVATGKYLRSLKGPGGRVVHVSFSHDNRLLAATTWLMNVDGALRVWDLRVDKVSFTVPVPGPKISGVTAFSADGKRLVGEGSQGLQVWDAHTGKEIQAVPVPGGCVALCFSPDGRHLAASAWHDKKVKIFEWNGDRLGEPLTLKSHSGVMGAVVYSPDGKCLASGAENEFTLCDAASLREIRTVQTPAQELAFAPDSRMLYAAATVAKVLPAHAWTRWDVGAQKELPALSVKVSFEPVHAVHCLSRDGKVLFLARGVGATYIRAIDTTSGEELYPCRGHVASLNAVAISPDGRTLA